MNQKPDAQPATDSTKPEAERRAPERVSNGQGSGNGSATALSKLKMLERTKRQWFPRERPSGE